MSTASTPPLLIGLTGRAGAGKDTVAGYLEDAYGCAPIALADPILDMLGALIQHVDVDGAWLIERDLKEQPRPVLLASYRQLARAIGDALRAIDADFWVRIAAHHTGQLLAMGNNVCLTDVRYPNEAQELAAMGGVLVCIERPAHELPSVQPHSSESHTDSLAVQHTLINNGSRATLEDQIDRLMEQLLREPRS